MTADDIEASKAPLIEHLTELRSRLIKGLAAFVVAFVLCFAVAKHLFNMLVQPALTAIRWSGHDPDNFRFIYTAPQEFFFTQVKVAAFGALCIAFPIIATQVYKFVAPGLYRHERQAFLPFLIATPLLFLLGGALVYFVFMPLAMAFFLSMQQAGGEGQPIIELLPRTSEYLSLIMSLIFAFGFVFQLPVVTTLLARADIIDADTLKAKRKWAIVIAFIVAAVLTPPDPLSQFGLAIPTILLYEASILTVRLVEKRRRAARAAREAAGAA